MAAMGSAGITRAIKKVMVITPQITKIIQASRFTMYANNEPPYLDMPLKTQL